MSLSDTDQQRCWIIAQRTMDSNVFERLLSNMQILSVLYNKKCDDDDLNKKLTEIVKKIKNFRTFAIQRKQKTIQELKIEIDDLISEMINTIEPKNMFDMDVHRMEE